MSSATPTDVAQSRGIVRNLPAMKNKQSYGEGAGPQDGLSERQQRLDGYWRYFRCMNYDTRSIDWNGHPIVGQTEADTIGQSGVIPAGFYDATGDTMPLKFRKPSVPYYLVKVIVSRFTGLLFSKKRHPKITCDDPDTQDWLEGFAETTRLWSQAIQMRNYGGAQGSVALGFKFVHGKPYVEVHDARWCNPEFSDRALMTVDRMEKRYQFKEDVRNPENGEWEETWFWYRRLITDEEDVVWPKVPVVDETGDAGEPNWAQERFKRVTHNFGECPIVWVQNVPIEDDLDGDPDAYGAYDIIEGIDELLSCSHRGTKANCDPTVGIASDAEFEDIKKGSGHALQVEKGASIEYLEMSGTGIERAMMLADQLEDKALTIARCVLDRKDAGQAQRTATEVERTQASMLEQADIYREQYGELGIKRLLEMVLRVARRLNEPRLEKQADGTHKVMRTVVKLPKRRIEDADRAAHSTFGKPMPFKPTLVSATPERKPPTQYRPRVLGEGEEIVLKWPDYFEPSLETILNAVQAAGQARSVYNILDDRNAVEFIAPYLGIEDVDVVLERIKEQQKLDVAGGDVGNMISSLTKPK